MVVEDIIVEAIVAGINAWKLNDENAMDKVVAEAVRKLEWPVTGDDGSAAVIARLEAALDEHHPYAGCRDDLRSLVDMVGRSQ